MNDILFNNEEYCDFKIKLSNNHDVYVYCSKYILAFKSKYFMTLFATTLTVEGSVPEEFSSVFSLFLSRLHGAENHPINPEKCFNG
jgi:hypothetical protein